MIDNIKIEYIPIGQPIQAEYNPRKISEKAFEKLKDSIKRFGLVDPLLINKNSERENILIGGHQRLKAAKALKLDEVPAVFLDLTLEKERELNVRLNQNTGEFDESLLIEFFNANELEEWGFEDVSFFENEEEEGGDEGDYDDTPPVEPVSVLGDLYELHSLESGIVHRVQCGNSCDSDVVAKTLDGGVMEFVYTDPPYGMNAVSKSGVLSKKYKTDIIGDDNTDVAKDAFNLTISLFDCPQVWWGANYYSSSLPDSECWLVWDKNNGNSDQVDCELAWTNFRSVARMFTQASEKKNRVHSAQKPISLCDWAIEKSKVNISSVYDPFLGSGTTLIACEKLNRICYGQELDPKYMDVIVRRWISYMKENNRRFAVHRNGVMLTEDQIGELS